MNGSTTANPRPAPPAPAAEAPLLVMRGISKAYPGVQALKRVDFDVRAGEVHALVGENGAGKSTLMKILGGAEPRDEGEILLQGQRIELAQPGQAIAAGINVVYQELMLAPHLSAAENILLGNLYRTRWGTIDWARVYGRAQELIDSLGVRLDVRQPVGRLSVAQQQIVEIARSLQRQSKVLVLDEPSAVLGQRDMETLFAVIRRLTGRGVAVVYISHRLAEVFQIADRVTVLKDGEVVATKPIAWLDEDQLVRLMVGRELAQVYPAPATTPGPVLLSVEGLAREGVFEDIGFEVRAGEIVAIAGLVGSGRSAVARALFGADPYDRGTISVNGRPVRLLSPRDALRHGIGLLPEDRKSEGLLLNRPVRENVTIASLAGFTSLFALNVAKEGEHVRRQVTQLNIRTPGIGRPTRTLSGGNQQKVVLARWLSTRSRVLIFDEPTRGVDVGAKMEIYRLMRQLADQGCAILMVSSDLPEVLGMADRILVMRAGRIVQTFDRQSATEESVMQAALTGRVSNGSNASL